MRRTRATKIVATLGPASSTKEQIAGLFHAGADVFRLNFSHGVHADHAARVRAIREIEVEQGRPIGVLLDLQGPKLRVGAFEGGQAVLENGMPFRLDLDERRPGDSTRASLPHPEIFQALRPGSQLLMDDGKIRLSVMTCGPDFADTTVLDGGRISDRKGVNLPDVVLPLSALTDKDRRDLTFALELGIDWIALSFVQTVDDVRDLRTIVQGRAKIIAKVEKPSAVDNLDAIVAEADGVMIARGDLGVELPAEMVPAIQKRIVRSCRGAGKPVIVATQMLESMTASSSPTRAEASDVATAVYEGADSVMLSAESASGKFPQAAVEMMSRVICRTEADPAYRELLAATNAHPRREPADAIGCAAGSVADLLKATAMVAYTSSGYSALRLARERRAAPILAMTPLLPTARQLALVWGVHAVVCDQVSDVQGMTELGVQVALTEDFGGPGDMLVISAGLPFQVPGSTNLLRIAQIA